MEDLNMLFICYPKCSTCMKAKKQLETMGVDYELRDISVQNPTKEELKEWVSRSGLPLKKFFNTSGKLYRSENVKERLPEMSEEEIYDLLASNGMMVKRPILVNGDQVLVGYKEEAYQSLK